MSGYITIYFGRMKMKRNLIGIYLSMLILCGSNFVQAALIVDTGTGPDSLGGWSLDTDQWLSAEFNLDQDTYLTGLYGWMSNNNRTGDNFTISIYGDGGEIPDSNNLLYSNGGQISGTEGHANWEGYEITYTDPNGNTGLFLTAGTYWLGYELRTINYNNPYVGAMPNDSQSPLDNYAFNGTGTWQEYDSLNLGVRIEGTPAAPVPEPATMLLFGTGLIGLVGSRLRKTK